MSKELRDQDYLEHIQQAISKIERYLAGKTETEFMEDELIQDAVIRNLEIIGEAVTKLSPDLKASYSEIPWGEIAGMRNRLIHGYIAVNLQIVWDTVEKALPDFRTKVWNIQHELAQASQPRQGK